MYGRRLAGGLSTVRVSFGSVNYGFHSSLARRCCLVQAADGSGLAQVLAPCLQVAAAAAVFLLLSTPLCLSHRVTRKHSPKASGWDAVHISAL